LDNEIEFKPECIINHIKKISEDIGYSSEEKEHIKKKIDNTEKFVKFYFK
jgi:hypothetical protein